ncbi:MAG: phosphoribosylaminoimidazolesuccinocarboxamide synthase [Calditrichaceae bacterium]
MNCLINLKTPQIKKIHSGKVRESFRIDKNTRMIIATDRISSFDSVLKTPIPGKGAVLNQLAAYWFENTKDIIDNHFVRLVDSNISLVKEATPIRVEMIDADSWGNDSTGLFDRLSLARLSERQKNHIRRGYPGRYEKESGLCQADCNPNNQRGQRPRN